MREFLMLFGRLWLIIICFSGSSFVPQMRPRRPHRWSLFQSFAIITSVGICQDLASLTFIDEALLKHAKTAKTYQFLSSFNWPLLFVNFKETSEAKTRREREDLEQHARVGAPSDEASRGGRGLFS